MKLGWNVINIQVNWIAVYLKHAWSFMQFLYTLSSSGHIKMSNGSESVYFSSKLEMHSKQPERFFN